MSDLGMPPSAATGASSVDGAGIDLLRFDDDEGMPGADGGAVGSSQDPFVAGIEQALASGAAAGTVFEGGAPGNPFSPGMGPGTKHSSAGRLSSFVEIPPVGGGEGSGKSPLENSDPFALPPEPVVQMQAEHPGDPLL